MMSRPHDEKPFPGLLVEAWRTDTASSAELVVGYRRFLRERAKRRLAPRVAAWLFAGAVLGVGLAQAASALPLRWFHSQPSSVVQPPVARATAPRARAAASVPTASLAPSATQPEPSATTPIQLGRRPLPVASAFDAAPSVPTATPNLREQWQQVAIALRSNDFARAESALLELERSASGSERDAARLSRAQLLSSHGHYAQALELAMQLAASAQSDLVRDQARELQTRLLENDGVRRSNNQDAGVKQP